MLKNQTEMISFLPRKIYSVIFSSPNSEAEICVNGNCDNNAEVLYETYASKDADAFCAMINERYVHKNTETGELEQYLENYPTRQFYIDEDNYRFSWEWIDGNWTLSIDFPERFKF